MIRRASSGVATSRCRSSARWWALATSSFVPCEDSLLQIEVVLKSDPHVSAQEDRHRRHGELHPRHARDDVGRGRRQLVPHVEEIVGRCRDAAVDAHHELEVGGFLHDARVDQFPSLLDEADVEGLDLRLDVQVEHRLREELDRFHRVHVDDRGGAAREVQRARREAPHLRFRLQGRGTIGIRVPGDPARRGHHDELRPLSDLVHGLFEDLEPGSGPFVLVPAMDVDDRCAGLLAQVGGLRDLVRRHRHVRGVLLPRDRAGRGHRDDELLHGAPRRQTGLR